VSTPAAAPEARDPKSEVMTLTEACDIALDNADMMWREHGRHLARDVAALRLLVRAIGFAKLNPTFDHDTIYNLTVGRD
jgi:hypothetical protein